MKNRNKGEITHMVSTRFSNLPHESGSQRSSRPPGQAFYSSERGGQGGGRWGQGSRRGGSGNGSGNGGSSGGGGGGHGNNTGSGERWAGRLAVRRWG